MCEVRGSRALGISARKVNIEAYTQKHDLIYHLVGHMWEWPLLSDDCMMSGTAYVWWHYCVFLIATKEEKDSHTSRSAKKRKKKKAVNTFLH